MSTCAVNFARNSISAPGECDGYPYENVRDLLRGRFANRPYENARDCGPAPTARRTRKLSLTHAAVGLAVRGADC